jgi:hypothetical protein
MTKKEVVWLITKLFGVFFAYWTVVAVFVLIGSVYAYIQLPSPPRFGKSESAVTNVQPGPFNPTISTPPAATAAAENPAEAAKNAALKQLLWDLLLVVIYGLIAWYLIRDGRFLFALLNREAPYDESGKPIEQDSFPLAKKKENVVTTLNLSDVKTEDNSSDEQL